MLLSNKETITRKRKLEAGKRGDKQPKKKAKLDERIEPMPGCSTWSMDIETTSSVATGDTGKETISSTEEQLYSEAIHDEQEINFRFELLRYSFNPQQALKSACEKHGIDIPYSMWDLIDNQEGKSVNVYIDISERRLMGKFDSELFSIGDSCNAFYVLPEEIEGKWRFETPKANGEVKIATFLASRKELFQAKSIMVVPSSYEKDPIGLLSVSNYINECVKTWKTKLVSNDQENADDDDLYKDLDKPKTLRPKVLLEGIVDTRKIDDTREYIEWKGKLLPEGFTKNIITEEWSDREMVLLIMPVLKEAVANAGVIPPLNKNSSLNLESISCLLSAWECSYQNTFDLLQGNRGVNIKPLARALGMKMKGRTYKDADDYEARRHKGTNKEELSRVV